MIRKTKLIRVLSWALVILFLIGAGSLFVGYLAITDGMFGHVPSDEELKAIKNYQATAVYTSDNKLLGRYYLENRTEVTYDQVSPKLIDALIATEDARFYEHKGIDKRSMLRVLVKTLLLGQHAGGGSTLSQQLTKNLFGRKNYGLLSIPINKAREAIIANKLENLYTKEEILTLYLNTVSFGEDTYGIETASLRFFSTHPDKLTYNQAAVLVGMLKAPDTYNPRTHPGKSLQRRNVVLSQLANYDYISKSMADSLKQLPIILSYRKLGHQEGSASYFRAYLKNELKQKLKDINDTQGMEYDLHTDGLKVYTTIDSRLQRYAEEAVAEHLDVLNPRLWQELSRKQTLHRSSPLVVDELKKTTRYKRLIANGMSQKNALVHLSQPVETTWVSSNGIQDTLISPLDSVRHSLAQLQAGFMVVSPTNGSVLAWVGGRSFQQSQYDHVLATRQVGSVFKPIVYARALMDGYSPCDFIPNQKVIYTQYDNWTPQNSSGEYEGNYSLLGALTNSVNTVSVRLCMEAGIARVLDLAANLGIKQELPQVPSVALGSAGISLMELIEAYTAFAHQGQSASPYFITKIEDRTGKVLYEGKPQIKAAIPENVANELTGMLASVVDKGTARRLRSIYGIRGAIAGKTGTTQNHTDGWFMGYTPQWLGGVWVGADNPAIHFSTIADGQGANTALPIWALFYQKIQQDKSLSHLLKGSFSARNAYDCELYKDDSGLVKLFRKKQKRNHEAGIYGDVNEESGSEDSPRKKKRLKDRIKDLFRKK